MTLRHLHRRRAIPWLCAALAAAAAVSLAHGYVPLRFVSAVLPPASWPAARIPLATVIHSAGSADVSGNADVLAVQAAHQSWNAQNTSYFFFATPSVSSAASLNDGDGVNSILWDETGSVFPPGDTTLAATVLRVDLATGAILDADTVFNGAANTWSALTPTPAGRFDIQAVATHEMGHMVGLDHSPVISAALYPDLPPASEEGRSLSFDDGRGLSALYPESISRTDFGAPSAGEGDASESMGRVSGKVVTQGGSPVPGAHLVALDAGGSVAAGALTATDGSYQLAGLPAGAYQVAAGALEGPVREADLGSGRAENFLTGYSSVFSGGNVSPSWLTVSPRSTTGCPDLVVGRPDLPEAEPNGIPGEAAGLWEGGPRSGTIGIPSDADYYAFPVSAGEILMLDVDSGGDGNPLDPILTLFDPGGALPLFSVDDTVGKGLDPRIARPFSTAGTYYARVTHAFNEGDAGYGYTLSLSRCVKEAEPNGTAATAQPVTPGARRGGTLSSTSDADLYAFPGDAGDRLHAEITAARSGSPLDAKMTLLGPDAIAILASSTDAYGKDPSVDYTLPGGAAPGTYYLKVEAQSGAASGAWYCLSLDRTPLQVEASARVSLASGVAAAVPDSFPQRAAPGESFDLVVAGYGVSPGTEVAVTGDGIALLPTTGPSFALDAQGRGLKAFSIFVSTTALPGARSLRLQDGKGREILLPGLLILRAVAAPGEVAGGSGSPLGWSGNELIWKPVAGASGYGVYRGTLSSLADLDGNGLADSYGASLACGIPEPVSADPAVPPPGDGYFYLVDASNGYGRGGMGYASNGLPRPLSALNPACP